MGEEDQKSSSLTDDEAHMIAKLLIDLEERNGKPQDFEWAFENGNQLCHACLVYSHISVCTQVNSTACRPDQL